MNYTLYVPGDKEEAYDKLGKAQKVAADLGYVGKFGKGSLAALLLAIAEGEVHIRRLASPTMGLADHPRFKPFSTRDLE